MHYYNSLFVEPSMVQPFQNDLICLVLTDFTQNTDIGQIKLQIQEQFSFIFKIHNPNNLELECYFQSMTDLIELDQGKKFGAGRAFIRDINQQKTTSQYRQETQKQFLVFKNSQQSSHQQQQFPYISFKLIPSEAGLCKQILLIGQKLLIPYKMQRLTSLQDVIEELQNIREKLDIYKESCDHDMTFETDEFEDSLQKGNLERKKYQIEAVSNKNCVERIEQFPEEKQIRHTQTNTRKLFMSVFEGLALTGVIFGGFKLIKNYME